MRCTGQRHFEATKQLDGRNNCGSENYDIWRDSA
jgi:hypothetical protein